MLLHVRLYMTAVCSYSASAIFCFSQRNLHGLFHLQLSFLGNFTCAGYPGITLSHARQDAQLFAEWEVDYVKLDGCYSLPLDMDVGYPNIGRHLNNTGRPMIYSCSWPVYQIYAGITVSSSVRVIISSFNLLIYLLLPYIL